MYVCSLTYENLTIYHRYQGKEGYAPAAYLQRYHGAAKEEAATGAQVVTSVKDILLMSTTSNQGSLPAPTSNPKPAKEDNKQTFAPTWHSLAKPYIDKERKYRINSSLLKYSMRLLC